MIDATTLFFNTTTELCCASAVPLLAVPLLAVPMQCGAYAVRCLCGAYEVPLCGAALPHHSITINCHHSLYFDAKKSSNQSYVLASILD